MSVLSIHNTAPSINIGRNLLKANGEMSKSMQRLSSGFRINVADDDPSGLLQSEKLRAQIAGLNKELENSKTSRDVMNIADGALGQVQGLLRTMRGYAIHALNSGVLSSDQIAADQAQIDAGLNAINRIFESTNYAGQKLLAFSNPFNKGSRNANYGGGSAQAANVVATPEAYLKGKFQDFLRTGENALGLTFNTKAKVDENGVLTSDLTFTVADPSGEAENALAFDAAAGSSLADVVQRLRGQSVSDDDLAALADKAAQLKEELGRDPTAVELGLLGRIGKDIDAVDIDGQALAHLQSLDDEAAAGFLADYIKDFASTTVNPKLLQAGDGSFVKLSKKDEELLKLGEDLKNLNSDNIGLVTMGKNGEKSYTLADLYGGHEASLSSNAEASLKVLDQSIKDIAMQRASIGATQRYALDAHIENLYTQVENLTKSESDIRDTDYAKEMTKFVQSQVLVQAGMQMLSAVNDQRKGILNLLA